MCFFTPEVVLILVGLLLLLVDAFVTKLPKRFLGYLGCVAFVVTAFMLPNSICSVDGFWGMYSEVSGGAFISRRSILISQLIILASGFLTLVMLMDSSKLASLFVSGSERKDEGTGELYILPIFAVAGMLWMTKATNLIAFFVALEMSTLAFYVMVGYFRRNVGSLEAGVKYLILGAVSAAFFVFGMAWLYGTTGTFSLEAPVMSSALGLTLIKGGSSSALLYSPAALLGIGFIFLAFFFKVGVAPMHIWTPDVYQGAPTPITALLSVASKTAGFCGLFIFCFAIKAYQMAHFELLITVLSILTLVIGNFGALGQKNVKRMLGYSSIAHAGFVLPFLLSPSIGWVLYLLCYLPMTYGAFFIISLVRAQTGREDLSAFKGLAKRNPRLAAVATLMFASLAGVPLTAGFTAKLTALIFLVRGDYILLLVVALLAAATGFYYYFKPIKAMYWEKSEEELPPIQVPVLTGGMLLLLSVVIFFLGLLVLGMNV